MTHLVEQTVNTTVKLYNITINLTCSNSSLTISLAVIAAKEFNSCYNRFLFSILINELKVILKGICDRYLCCSLGNIRHYGVCKVLIKVYNIIMYLIVYIFLNLRLSVTCLIKINIFSFTVRYSNSVSALFGIGRNNIGEVCRCYINTIHLKLLYSISHALTLRQIIKNMNVSAIIIFFFFKVICYILFIIILNRNIDIQC